MEIKKAYLEIIKISACFITMIVFTIIIISIEPFNKEPYKELAHVFIFLVTGLWMLSILFVTKKVADAQPVSAVQLEGGRKLMDDISRSVNNSFNIANQSNELIVSKKLDYYIEWLTAFWSDMNNSVLDYNILQNDLDLFIDCVACSNINSAEIKDRSIIDENRRLFKEACKRLKILYPIDESKFIFENFVSYLNNKTQSDREAEAKRIGRDIICNLDCIKKEIDNYEIKGFQCCLLQESLWSIVSNIVLEFANYGIDLIKYIPESCLDCKVGELIKYMKCDEFTKEIELNSSIEQIQDTKEDRQIQNNLVVSQEELDHKLNEYVTIENEAQILDIYTYCSGEVFCIDSSVFMDSVKQANFKRIYNCDSSKKAKLKFAIHIISNHIPMIKRKEWKRLSAESLGCRPDSLSGANVPADWKNEILARAGIQKKR